ncbi:tetratricopeptide repeat protein [Nocardia sp. NPDC127579]|uniref:tetratricopeptide repeat protein n=1 Tax=Nocardia sp. NPDC127579 TaxID=3345402 RepID=UPI00362722DD
MSGPRLRKPPLVLLLAIALIGSAAVAGFALTRPLDTDPVAVAAIQDPLAAEIDRRRERLNRLPDNAIGWAELGTAYVELARITADPTHYGQAQRALDRSIQLRPTDNAEALTGFGVLSNALHNFAAARRYAEQSLALRPDDAATYGVLADAQTQLGVADAATAAIQRMLELRPGVASFTRAAYDFELHGQVDAARQALDLALAAAATADQSAFCRYHLGELAFHSGQLDEAETQYRAGLSAAPTHAALQQGMAKVAAARGDIDQAIARYTELTTRTPSPEYLIEFGELLQTVGRAEAAAAMYQAVSERIARLEAQGATEYLDAALLAADHGDPAEAVRLAELEYSRRQSVLTADVLAWALHKAGRHTEALTYADRAATLGWRNATLAYRRGMILAALGRPDEAITALADALGINPYFSPLHVPIARRTLSELQVR